MNKYLLFGLILLFIVSGCAVTKDKPTKWPQPKNISVGEFFYPRLQANIFSSLSNTPSCSLALSSYDAITTGAVYSTSLGGGYDYGSLSGFGSWKNTLYVVGKHTDQRQKIYKEAKELNPNLKIFSHRSINKEESQHFDDSTNQPQRWFVDALSPRWFAYTPLMELQESVSDPNTLEFKFSAKNVKPLQDWGLKGQNPATWAEDNKFDWYYLSFFDNDADGGRGSFEIMAIKDVTINGNYGVITVAKNKKGDRAIFGSSQTYSTGDRAGILSSSSPTFGSLVFLMNRVCIKDIEDKITGCKETRVKTSNNRELNWIEANAEFVDLFYIPAQLDGIYLNDGIILDADQEFWREYGFKLGGETQNKYYLDQDFDGMVDDLEYINERLYFTHQEYYRLIKEKAKARDRPDFSVIVNGYLNPGTNAEDPLPHPYVNGRRYEDFNENFEGTYLESLQQYVHSHYNPDFLGEPVYSLISERDREFISRGEVNYEEHRNILAMTLAMGEGMYGHDSEHATSIPACTQRKKDDWFDEFSVDPKGVSSKHPNYMGDVVCEQGICQKNRVQYIGWLGRALGNGYNLSSSGYEKVYRRDFERGIVLFSLDPKEVTLTLEKPYKKIKGVDPDNRGNLFNDGSEVTTVTLPKKTKDHQGRGIILLNTQ